MKLSIIIPIYNIRQWLSRCFSSCLNQGLPMSDFEIIAVDDGSTDDSLSEVERLKIEAGKEVNWIIVHQENQGLSAARNAGLRVAHGEYVWWVDGDDFLELKCAEKLVAKMDREQLDVLCFGLNLYTDGEPPVVSKYPIPDETRGAVVDGPTFMLQVGMPPAAWAAIYRRDFLLQHQLVFMPGIFHEDQEFTPRAYFLAERIALEPIIVYNYVQREGSIMQTLNPKRGTDLLLICDRLWEFAHQHATPGTPIYNVLINRVSFLFSQSLSTLCRCGIFEFPRDIASLPYYPLSINKQMSSKERAKYRLINASVPLYMKLYRKFNSQHSNKKPRLRTR